MSNFNLTPIIALARSGAISRAWDAFGSAGLADIADNPQILTLKGRLLKDRARKASGDVGARLYLQSAKAYADAAALRPDTYPLINAATMSLFAGQRDHMAMLAQRVLTMLETGIGVGETPYWHQATRAEALLLLGRQAEARAALDLAIMAAPFAWEDRAATLRQFRKILEFKNESSIWLSDYAPPSSVYFKGMIGISPEDNDAARAAHDEVARMGGGFGYGALAAGADILIAEALVARGAELHVVLPVTSSAFRRQSVAPFGDEWLSRFDQLFQQAASVRVVATNDSLTDSSIKFAAQVAKGAAIEKARLIEGFAAGLELNDYPSSEFDSSKETLVSLKRTAPTIPGKLEAGQMHFTLVSDKVGDPENWTPIADGFYLRNASSAEAINALMLEQKKVGPKTRSAIDISTGDANTDLASAQNAQLLRLAQCTPHETTIANARTALAMLSQFPAMSIEPLGELHDAGSALEIYAIEPAA